jgi:hypothetical protein
MQEKIGEGGMSVVYRAVHRNLQRGVAVKVLRAPAEDGAAGPDWLRESRLTAALAHPHVVTVHDAGQVDGHPYLVMEYLAGGSLRSRMQPGQPWPPDRAAAVLDCIARALEHIHGQGVLHLDLKPENILYTADGQVKVADFGLSMPDADAHALLGGTAFRGTIDYCAPERRAGLAPDARFDVFSLATLAYELLTGRLPGRVYVPASRRNPRLPAGIDEVLRRGLARDPAERYATIAALREALAGACRPARRRVPVRLLAVALGLAALVAVLVVVGRWTPTPPPPDLPTGLWVLYDKPDDLALFTGDDGRELSGGSDVAVQRVPVEDPHHGIPPALAVPFWPAPRPALVIRSAGAWGFVHPLGDRTLGQRVVSGWPALLRAVVPPQRNFVRAGGFDGDCLATSHRGLLWRVSDAGGWHASRQITLERPADRPDNPALLLTNLEPAQDLLSCYQPLPAAPGSGAVVVLRYRARAGQGKAGVAVYAGLPVAIPDGETGPVVSRVRAAGLPLNPEPDDAAPGRWLYRCPVWVAPAADWQTYVVVVEAPPFPTRPLHRNLVIDAISAGQVWVDDVELFAWQPGSEP